MKIGEREKYRSFQILSQLFRETDQATSAYVTDISSKVIATINSFVSVDLTISCILYVWLIMRGAVDMPVFEFLNRCICISIITSIAFIAGRYLYNEYA
ncbi:hypothetical protein ABID23_000256 [Bartonella silvatica]|uniref:ABC transmembrane type-1 domain-containing protein n=1 Tax=Bartonella silvatica TaxID=357760 RepID=A0ABV2HF77_9HYPH